MEISLMGVEYLYVPFTMSVDIDTQPVDFAFLSQNSAPGEKTTWRAASWMGDPGRTRLARILLRPLDMALDPGDHVIWVRVTDEVEVLVRRAGPLKVT